jgi:hypothetical protein
MFGLFIDNALKDFWSNVPGDMFIDSTINFLKVDRSSVDLNYYFINEVPSFYEFDQDKKLIIKKEIITINEVQTQNELGEDVVIQEEVKTYEIDKVIEPVAYFAKGLMIKPC